MKQRRLVVALAVLAFLGLCWIPTGLLLASGFLKDGVPSLAHLKSLFIDPVTGSYDPRVVGLLRNTMIIGLGAATASTALALPAAWLLARTRLPLSGLFGFLLMAPLIVPPYVHGIAVTQFLWDIGKVDWVVRSGITIPELGGHVGAIVLLTISLFPMALLLCAKGFRGVDGNAEDAAVLTRGPWTAFWRVSVPLALPSIFAGFLFVFVFAVSEFGIPDFLSFAYPKIAARQVFATEIFMQFSKARNSELAAVSSLPLILIVGIAAAWLLRLETREDRVGRGVMAVEPPTRALGRWKPIALLYLGVLVGATAVLPLAQLVHWAFRDGQNGRFAEMRNAFRDAGPDIGRSFLLALGAALLMVAIALPLAHAFERARSRAARTRLALFAFLPIAFPAMLLTIGEIRFWNRIPGPVYDSVALVLLTYVARFLPLAFLNLRAGIRGFDPAQEDAARLSGRGYLALLAKVVGPGIAQTLASAVLIGFVLSMRELDAVAILPRGSDTLPMRVYSMVHTARDSVVACLCLVLVVSSAVPLLVWRYVLGKRVRVL
jgi:iron(III) transport system permease protein